MKTFLTIFLFFISIQTLDEPEGLKLSDIYKIRQQMQKYLKSNTKLDQQVKERKLMQKNDQILNQVGIQQDRYLEPVALSRKQKRKLLQNFMQKNENNTLKVEQQKNNNQNLSKKI